jgi:hypothetical protein
LIGSASCRLAGRQRRRDQRTMRVGSWVRRRNRKVGFEAQAENQTRRQPEDRSRRKPKIKVRRRPEGRTIAQAGDRQEGSAGRSVANASWRLTRRQPKVEPRRKSRSGRKWRQRCNAEEPEVGSVRQGWKVDRRRKLQVDRKAAPKGFSNW